MLRQLAQKNTTLMAVAIFLLIFILIQIAKPTFLYKSDGSIREFGVGYRQKTILPIWLLSIFLGILSYVLICYIATPTITF